MLQPHHLSVGSLLNALFSLWLMRWACSEILAGTTSFLMFQLHTGLRQLCWCVLPTLCFVLGCEVEL